MAGQLKGKIALVTGASSGIGRATALTLARAGAKVVVGSRRTREGEETARLIRQAGDESIFLKTDVSKSVEVAALISKAVETYGRLDCAFNNAGIAGQIARTGECTEENWDETIATNLKGVWLCMKYEILQMLKQGGGTIVNNASVAGVVGFPGLPAYSASKGGIVQLTRTAALEYARSGIRINVVCPGGIRTPMGEGVVELITGGDPQVEAQLFDRLVPMNRWGSPEEIAEAVVWLCSDGASFVTGHTMLVDGGFVAQ